jgi:di/tricarboxylate transporter
MDLAWLSLLALVLVIAVSCTTRINPGIVAVALAGAIVTFAGPWFSNAPDLKSLWTGFPGELFLTLLGVSLLFTQAEVNGTLTRVAAAAQRLCGGNAGLLPIAFFGLALLLGTVGPGNIAAAGIVAPLAMASAERTGIPPLLMALMVGHGSIASTLSPFTAAGIVADNELTKMGLAGHAWEIYAYNALTNVLAAVAGYVIFGGWRLLRRRSPPPAAAGVADPAGGRDVSFERGHWITLAVIAALIASVISRTVHVGVGAFVGAAFLSILRLADERATFQKIPWSVIVMVCGVSVLASLLDKTGGTTRFANLIDAISTPRTVTGVLALVTGIVSIYSSTTGVVLPAFLPMVASLSDSQPGVGRLTLALSVLIGGNLVDMSPLSTIGALCIAAAGASVDRRILFNQLLAWGFALAFAAALLCWLLFSGF